jgi:L-alanine-DL-glutamate epimerase-like enolase superfamily enzyme
VGLVDHDGRGPVMTVPDGPGLGVEIDRSVIERHRP